MLLITTPISKSSKHYRHFRNAVACTAVSRRGHFEDFRPGFIFWHICHDDRHGHFTLKQLRLLVANEMHTNSYTGPRLNRTKIMEIISKGWRADAINDSSSSLSSILFVVIKFAFVLTIKYGYSQGFFD